VSSSEILFLVLLSLLYKRLKSTKNRISLLHLLSQAFALCKCLGNVALALALALSGLALLTSLDGTQPLGQNPLGYTRPATIMYQRVQSYLLGKGGFGGGGVICGGVTCAQRSDWTEKRRTATINRAGPMRCVVCLCEWMKWSSWYAQLPLCLAISLFLYHYPLSVPSSVSLAAVASPIVRAACTLDISYRWTNRFVFTASDTVHDLTASVYAGLAISCSYNNRQQLLLRRRTDVHDIYPVPDKTKPLLFYNNFGKCGSISTILSLLHLVINCERGRSTRCHLTSYLLSHYMWYLMFNCAPSQQ